MKRYWETRVENIKAGDRIMVDEGFTCIRPYSVVTVKDDRPWWKRVTGKWFSLPELYFECCYDLEDPSPRIEKHFLDGQIDTREIDNLDTNDGYEEYDVYVGILREREGWNAIVGDLLDAYWGEGDGWPEGPPSMVQAAIDATGWNYQKGN